MSKRKLRVNLMDILILIVILAAVAVLVYVYAGKSRTEVQDVETVFLEYVVEVPELDGSYANLLTEGDPVEDAEVAAAEPAAEDAEPAAEEE